MAKLGTLSAATFRMSLDALEAFGVDTGPLLDGAEISRDAIANPWARVQIESERKFWDLAVKHTGEEHLGVKLAPLIPFGTNSMLDYVGASCQSAYQVVALFSKYMSVIYSGFHPTVIETPRTVEFRLGSQSPPEESRHSTEFALTALWTRLELYSTQKPELISVGFRHSRRGSGQEYKSAFGKTPGFGEALDSLVLGPEIRTIPCKNSNSLVLGPLLQTLDTLANALAKALPSTASKCKGYIKSAIYEGVSEGGIKLSALAKSLGMSERTLQRKLDEEGQSLRVLVNDVRREEAAAMLPDSNKSIDEIAANLGFSSQSAFNRAFKSWFGETPAQFRKNLRKRG